MHSHRFTIHVEPHNKPEFLGDEAGWNLYKSLAGERNPRQIQLVDNRTAFNQYGSLFCIEYYLEAETIEEAIGAAIQDIQKANVCDIIAIIIGDD